MNNSRKAKEKYNVALSFAGEQRVYVKEVAKILKEIYGLTVFFDEFESNNLWGKNLYEYLHEIYSEKAEYVIIFTSKEYKTKIWTNHERKAAQERALKEKKEYILPVKFDDTKIPGLPSTVGYLDASKLSPIEVAKTFAKKYGLKIKNSWWGKWEKETISDAESGTLFIYDVTKEGFYFNLDVICGAHTGELEKEFAKFINQDKAVFTEENEFGKCLIEFFKLNSSIQVKERGRSCSHGVRAYFGGIYHLEKDIFYLKDISDEILSKIYKQVGKNFECFKKCFHNTSDEKKENKKILYGSVPGLVPYYSAILIVENENVRGAFLNADDNVYWFSTDNKIDKEITNWAKKYKKGIIKFKKVLPFEEESM